MLNLLTPRNDVVPQPRNYTFGYVNSEKCYQPSIAQFTANGTVSIRAVYYLTDVSKTQIFSPFSVLNKALENQLTAADR